MTSDRQRREQNLREDRDLARERRRGLELRDLASHQLDRMVAGGAPAADVADHVAGWMRTGAVGHADVARLADVAAAPGYGGRPDVGRAVEGVVAGPAVLRRTYDEGEDEAVASTSDLFDRLGQGAPLSKAARAVLEGRFAAVGEAVDFSNVRIHTGAEADELCRRYGAEAFTVGDHIVFRSGAFVPATRAGLELVAHELTHVIQQQRGVAPETGVSRPGDPVEREADRMATEVGRVEAVQPLAAKAPEHAPPTAAVMRKKKPAAAPQKPVENGDVVSGWVIYENEARKGGSLAWRNNNPGNIRPGSFTASHGAFPGKKSGGFAVFPDKATGFQAIKDLLSEKYANSTIPETISKYAPSSDNNDPVAYAKSIEKKTGIKSDRKISSLNDKELDAVAHAIETVEGWKEGTSVSRTDPKLPERARKKADETAPVARKTLGPAEDGAADAPATETAPEAPPDRATEKKTLEKSRGLRPRDYSNSLDGSNLAETAFREYLPIVTASMNTRAAAQGLTFRFNEAEIASNFLMEGGILALQSNATTGLDGFQYFGIDTFMNRYTELLPWLDESIKKEMVSSKTNQNEKSESVKSITNISLVQGLWANAAMWAQAKGMLDTDLRAMGTSVAELPDTRQMFWTTMYYNAGPGTGHKYLEKNGVEFADKKWTKGEDEANWTNAQYNAVMRTSTYEFFRDQECGTDGHLKPVPSGTDRSRVAADATARLARVETKLTAARAALATADQKLTEAQAQLAAATSAATRAKLEASVKSLTAKRALAEKQVRLLEHEKEWLTRSLTAASPPPPPAAAAPAAPVGPGPMGPLP